ncbi:MAG: hypothetical protein BroJett003_08080 [Planctomycetota bacterium]|nr:MAG: hypothetical protein BroJett003_08080 [Planctomycetota bacterium]
MNQTRNRWAMGLGTGWFLAVTMMIAPVRGQQLASASTAKDDELWKRTIELVQQGDLSKAAANAQTLPPTDLTQKVRGWLEEYEKVQAQRKELDRQDFEMYVRYAKERIERKEYALALEKAVRAQDNASDGALFLKEPWLESLVKDSLAEAQRLEGESEWEKAWEIYYYLGMLFENHAEYQKRERVCLNHLRLERIFEKDNKWDEPLRDIRLDMAAHTLEKLGEYYVDENLDFRQLTQAALEQLLLLTESKSAQERFAGLGDEAKRRECQDRLRERLRQVTQSAKLDPRGAAEYFARALDAVRKTVDLPENLVVSEMMRGALENVDDFTSNIWPADWDEFAKHTQGDFIGVGISIIKNAKLGLVEVVSPLEDTPAYRAGVQPGDFILKVNGQDISEYSINRVVDTITGPKGTQVTLSMRRGSEEFDLTLTREQVVIHTVKGVQRDASDPQRWNFWLDKEHGVAHVRVTSFAKNTVSELEAVLSQLRTEGMRGLILDLRGNPGGLLDQAENMSALFLESGQKVHSINGRIPKDNKVFTVKAPGAFRDLPLTVLVDENSASASEIVSGALRDNKAALVIGERTYGKFSVQNLIPVSRVPPAALKVTTAHYYLPSGASLHRAPGAKTWGVEPNISVPLVRKEMFKVYQMRRKADVIGVAKEEEDPLTEPAADAGEEGDEVAGEGDADEKSGAESADDADKKATEGTTEDDKPKLPPLEQPDKNDRPEVDPQLDTALLILRVTLLGQDFPTLATAATKNPAVHD